MKTLPVEQLTSFLQESKESGVLEMYYAELAARLRRGELLGLKWEDIDLDRGGLWVKRHGARINGELWLITKKATELQNSSVAQLNTKHISCSFVYLDFFTRLMTAADSALVAFSNGLNVLSSYPFINPASVIDCT